MMKKFVKRALLLSVFLVALFALTMLGASAATGAQYATDADAVAASYFARTGEEGSATYFSALNMDAVNAATENGTKAGTVYVLGNHTASQIKLGDGTDDAAYTPYDLTVCGVKVGEASTWPSVTYGGELFVFFDGSDLTLRNLDFVSTHRWMRIYNTACSEHCNIVFDAGTTVTQVDPSNDDFILAASGSYVNFTVNEGARLSRTFTAGATTASKAFISANNQHGTTTVAGELVYDFTGALNTSSKPTPAYLFLTSGSNASFVIKSSAAITYAFKGDSAGSALFNNSIQASAITVEAGATVNGVSYSSASEALPALTLVMSYTHKSDSKQYYTPIFSQAISNAKAGTTISVLGDFVFNDAIKCDKELTISCPTGQTHTAKLEGINSSGWAAFQFVAGANITFENIIITTEKLHTDGHARFGRVDGDTTITFGNNCTVNCPAAIFIYNNGSGSTQTANLTIDFKNGSVINWTSSSGEMIYHNSSKDWSGDGTAEKTIQHTTLKIAGELNIASSTNGAIASDKNDNSNYTIYYDHSTAEINFTGAKAPTRWFYLSEKTGRVYIKGFDTLAKMDVFAASAGIGVRSTAQFTAGEYFSAYSGFRGQIQQLALTLLPEGENTIYIIKNIDSIYATVHFYPPGTAGYTTRDAFKIVGAKPDGSIASIGFQDTAYRFQVHGGVDLTLDKINVTTKNAAILIDKGTYADPTKLIFTNGATFTRTAGTYAALSSDGNYNFVYLEGQASVAAADTLAKALALTVRLGAESTSPYAMLLNQAAVNFATADASVQATLYVLASQTPTAIKLGDGVDCWYDDLNEDGKQQTETEPTQYDTNFKTYHVIIEGVPTVSDGTTTYPTLTSTTDRFLLYDGSSLEFRNINIHSAQRWVRIYNRNKNDAHVCNLIFGENTYAYATSLTTEDFIYSQGGSYANITIEATARVSVNLTDATGNKRVIAFNNSYGDVTVRGTVEANIVGAEGNSAGAFMLFYATSSAGHLVIDSGAAISLTTGGVVKSEIVFNGAAPIVFHAGATCNGAALNDTTALALGLNMRGNNGDGTLGFYAKHVFEHVYFWVDGSATFTLLANANIYVYETVTDSAITIRSADGKTFTLTVGNTYAAFNLGDGASITLENLTLELGGLRLARIDGDASLILGDGATVNCTAPIFIYNNSSSITACGDAFNEYSIEFRDGSVVNWTPSEGSNALVYHNGNIVVDATVKFEAGCTVTFGKANPLVKANDQKGAYHVYIDKTAVLSGYSTTTPLVNPNGLLYLTGYDSLTETDALALTAYFQAVRLNAEAIYAPALTQPIVDLVASGTSLCILQNHTLLEPISVSGKTLAITAASADMTLALGTNIVTLQNGAYLTLQALKVTSEGTDGDTPAFTLAGATASTLKLLNASYTSTTGCDFVCLSGEAAVTANVIIESSSLAVKDCLLQLNNTSNDSVVNVTVNASEISAGHVFYTAVAAAPEVDLSITNSTVTVGSVFAVGGTSAAKLTVTLTGTKSGTTDANATYTNTVTASGNMFVVDTKSGAAVKVVVTGTSLNAPEKNVLQISGLADVAAGEGMTDREGNGNYALYLYAEDIYAQCFQFVYSYSANVTGGDILIELGGEKNGTGDSATHSNVVEFSTTGTSQLGFILMGSSSKPDTLTVRVRGSKITSTSADSDILFLYPTPAANDAVAYPVDVEFEGVTLSCVRRVLNMVDNSTGVPMRIAFLDDDMTAGDASTYSNEILACNIFLILRSCPEFDVTLEGVYIVTASTVLWPQGPVTESGVLEINATNVRVDSCSYFVRVNASVACQCVINLNEAYIIATTLAEDNTKTEESPSRLSFDFTAVYFDSGEEMAAQGAVAGVRVGAGYEYYSNAAEAAAAAEGMVSTEATFGDYVILLYDENTLSEEDQAIAQGMVAKYTNENGELVYTDSLHTAINEAKSGTIVYVLNNCTMTGTAGNDATPAGRYVKVVTITSGNNGPFTVTATAGIPFYLGAGSGVTFTNVKFVFNGRFGRIDGSSEIVFGDNAEIVANADIFIYSNKSGTLSAPTYSITVAATASINWTHATTTSALFYIDSVTDYDFNVTLNLYGTITVASPNGTAAIYYDGDKGDGTTVTVNMTNTTVLNISNRAFNLTKGSVTLSGFDTDAKADAKARELGLIARYDGKYYMSFMAVTVAAAEDTDVVIYLINDFTIASGSGIAVGTDSPSSGQNTGLTLPIATKLTIIGINAGTEQAPVYPTLTSDSNRAFGLYNAADLMLENVNISTSYRLLQVNGAGSASNPVNITLGNNTRITVLPYSTTGHAMHGGELFHCNAAYTVFTVNASALILYDFSSYATDAGITFNLAPVYLGANASLNVYGNITVNVPAGKIKSGSLACCVWLASAATSTVTLQGAAPLTAVGEVLCYRGATPAALNVTGAANATLPCLIGQEAGYTACIAGTTSGTYLFKTSLDDAFTDVAEGGTIWVLKDASHGMKGTNSTAETNDKSWTKSLTLTSGGKGISTVSCSASWAAFNLGGGAHIRIENIDYVLSTRLARLDGSCSITFGEGATVTCSSEIFIYANDSAVTGSTYNITVEDGALLKWTVAQSGYSAMIYTGASKALTANVTVKGDIEITPDKPLLYFNVNTTPVVKFEGTASVTGGTSKLISVPYNSPIKLYMKGFDSMDAANTFAKRMGAVLLYNQSQNETPDGALYGGFVQLYIGNFDFLNDQNPTITVISNINSINGTIWLTAGNTITVKSWNGAVLGSQSGEHRIRIAGGTDLILDGVTVENPGALFALHGGFEDNHSTLKLINGAKIVGTVGATAGYPGRLISFAGESHLSNTTTYGEAGGASAYSDLYVDEGCEIKQTGTAADSTSLIYICDNWYGTVTVKGKISAQVTFPTTTVGVSGGGTYHARLLYMDNTAVTATSGTVVLAPTAVLAMNATFPFVDAEGNPIDTTTQAVPTYHTACCAYLTGVQGRIFVADGATVTNTHSGASTSSALVCGSFTVETGETYVLAGVTLNGTYYLVGIAEQVRPGASAGTEDRVVIADANGAYYPIVYKDGAFYNAQGHSLVSLSNTWGGEIAELINSLLGITGATHRTDATTTANEILVGRVDRAEYAAYLQTLEVNEYAIVIQNGKIMLVAWNDATLKLCVDQFKAVLQACVTTVNGVSAISLPASLEQVVVARPEWVVSFTRPSESGDVSLSASQYVNNGSVQFLYTGAGATQITFMTYYNKLIAQGYTKVWSNNIGNNLYALLVNHNTGVTLYVAYCDFTYASDFNNTLFPQEEVDLAADYTGSGTPDFSDDNVTVDYEKCIRVISAPIGALKLPSEELINGKEYSKITDTKMVTLPFRSKAIGLGHVYLLEDGTFFIVDGGGVNVTEETTDSEGKTYYPNANGVTEWQAMWNVIVELYTDLYGEAPSETNKVHISAWYLTHSHWDHYQAFYTMLQKYGSMIEMDYMLGNFSGEYTNSLISELGWASTDTYIDRLKGYVGGFDFVKLHAGQVLHIVNLDIEVLMTFEDHLPHELRDSNDTSTVSRFTVNNSDAAEGTLGTTIMMLGDSWRMNSRHLCVMFGGDVNGNGNYLGSDIVQAAHHCNVGCERILYKRVAARAVLISNDTSATQSYLYWTNIAGANLNWYRAYLYMADKWLISNDYVNYVLAAPYANSAEGAGAVFNVLEFTSTGPNFDGVYDLYTGPDTPVEYTSSWLASTQKAMYIKKTANTVTSVQIAWGSFSFTYSGETGTWNPGTHEYEGGSGAEGWVAEGNNTITVMNTGDTALTVAVNYTPNTGYESFEGSFTADGAAVTKGQAVALATRQERVYTFNLATDELPDESMNYVTVGTVTVTIATQ